MAPHTRVQAGHPQYFDIFSPQDPRGKAEKSEVPTRRGSPRPRQLPMARRTPALAMERSKRGSRSMVRPLSRPHTSGFVRSNAHGQRLARAWSQSDLSQLSILERNTRQMLEKATNSMRLPFLEEDCLRTLSIPMKTRDLSDCKKKSRSTAMLDVAGFGLQLDDEEEKGEEPPVEEAIEQLKRLAAQATDPKMSLAISGIVGELQAGVCTVRFYADGSIGRFVTLHALRLLRPEDDHVLMQVGRWRPRNGFLPSCGFPGSKRPSAKDFNSYIDFLIRYLVEEGEGWGGDVGAFRLSNAMAYPLVTTVPDDGFVPFSRRRLRYGSSARSEERSWAPKWRRLVAERTDFEEFDRVVRGMLNRISTENARLILPLEPTLRGAEGGDCPPWWAARCAALMLNHYIQVIHTSRCARGLAMRSTDNVLPEYLDAVAPLLARSPRLVTALVAWVARLLKWYDLCWPTTRLLLLAAKEPREKHQLPSHALGRLPSEAPSGWRHSRVDQTQSGVNVHGNDLEKG
eukprot:g21471.t1